MKTITRNFDKVSDPLGETLYHLRLNGSLYCRSVLTAPWGMKIPSFDGKMMFHIVISGSCWLQVEKEKPVKLDRGSMVLVPHGLGHTIFSEPKASLVDLFDIPVEKVSPRYEVIRTGGDGELTELTCCVFGFDHVTGRHLIDQLPQIMVLDGMGLESDEWLQSTLRFIALESRILKPGGDTIITHLADILVIQAIRKWINSAPEANEGWFAALRDKQVGKALTAIHREPERHWTVDSLAKEVAMSRSAFSAKFSQMVGNSVKRYLTKLRMQIARNNIEKHSTSLTVIAEQLGYASEAAFSRAFKRIFGVPPGSFRNAKDEAS